MTATATLQNGMTVSCLQKREVPFISMEVQSYFAHNSRLQPGDTVFDVGANIGLFSLTAYAHCERNLRVYAFEPVRPIFDVLESNIRSNVSGQQVRIFNFGLSDRAGVVPFAYYPHAPVLSTAYADKAADLQLIEDLVLKNLIHLDAAPLPLRCLRWLPESLRATIVHHGLERALQAETVSCQMQTLSQFIGEHSIERIDLLKIDVEKAELDVLRGIAEKDWHRIRQLVVELHDIEGRLATIRALLQARGMTEVAIEQPPTLKNSNIYTLFAQRL
jgi:FkbM family methyltransferase